MEIPTEAATTRTDAEILQDVLRELEWDTRVEMSGWESTSIAGS
jgi:hypothetical protein